MPEGRRGSMVLVKGWGMGVRDMLVHCMVLIFGARKDTTI